VHPHTLYGHLARLGPFDLHPHGAEGAQGGEAVRPLEKAGDAGGPLRQRTEHDGTVGDGLVARHPQAALQGAAGVEDEICAVFCHGWRSPGAPLSKGGRLAIVTEDYKYQAHFRFHGVLNDFLPPQQKRQWLSYAFRDHPGIKDPIETLGAPHSEVALILVDGRPVDFRYQLRSRAPGCDRRCPSRRGSWWM